MSEKKRLTINVSKTTYQRMKIYGAPRDLNLSDIVRTALVEYFKIRDMGSNGYFVEKRDDGKGGQ